MSDGAWDLKLVATVIRGAVATSAALLVSFAILWANAAAEPFGLASLSSTSSTTQAGSHPDISTAFALSTDAAGNPVGQLKNAAVTLPAGMIGNPRAAARCAQSIFQQFSCPAHSQVGVMELSLIVCQGASEPLAKPAQAGETVVEVPNTARFCAYETGESITIGSGATAETATIEFALSATQLALSLPLQHAHAAGETVTHIAEPVTAPIPLFDLMPTPGHAATFGASLLFVPIFVQADVEADGQLRIAIANVSRLITVQGAKLTLWGVPADASHDAHRCNQLFVEECELPGGAPQPFTTYPAACNGTELETQVMSESWAGEGALGTTTLPPPTGCEKLKIAPTLSVRPEAEQRSEPSGYEITVTVPQEFEPYELATPPLRSVTVRLPEGTSLSPGLGVGLQACGDALFAQDACPEASKVGTVEIRTPLLGEPLTGAVYIGAPTTTEKYRLFLDASTPAVDMHIFGHVAPDAATGQLTASFEDLPQLPFGELKLDLFGGADAVLANPANCGMARSTAQFTSYAGQTTESSSTFNVLDNGEGGGCPQGAAFSPGFVAGTMSPVAGSFSPFVLRISRTDGQSGISGFTAKLPPGLVGLIASVTPCPEPQAAVGTCSQAAQVGTTTIAAGSGAQPLDVSGPVYLTGPYDGAPFGLVAVVHAVVGPFDLGTIVVRSRITVDPSDLALTVDTSSLPQIVGGVPLRLRMIDVTLDRPGFMVNPTNCEPQAIAGTVESTQGTSVGVSEHFQVAGCDELGFAPRLTVTVPARVSRNGNGAELDIAITEPNGRTASLRSVTIELPKQLRPRLSTIQGACLVTAATADLSKCPTQSIIGRATVSTPVLRSPLTGSIYLVAHGGTARPSLMLVLESEGIAVDLKGEMRISRMGVIKTDFANLPPVAISSLAVVLLRGPHSILGAIGGLCRRPLTVPYGLVDQNGATIERKQRILVQGCPKRANRKHGRV